MAIHDKLKNAVQNAEAAVAESKRETERMQQKEKERRANLQKEAHERAVLWFADVFPAELETAITKGDSSLYLNNDGEEKAAVLRKQGFSVEWHEHDEINDDGYHCAAHTSYSLDVKKAVAVIKAAQ